MRHMNGKILYPKDGLPRFEKCPFCGSEHTGGSFMGPSHIFEPKTGPIPLTLCHYSCSSCGKKWLPTDKEKVVFT